MNSNSLNQILYEKDYELQEKIGSGAFADCYKIYSFKYKQHFACKAIKMNSKHQELSEQSYTNELNALSTIIHPNIIRVFETFNAQDYTFLILELCENGDMLEYVTKNGPLKGNQLYNYLEQMLNAFEYLESNKITHNDIKPSNIFIDKLGRIKIADFGLSKEVKTCDDLSCEYNGSIGFMAPEVYERKPYNPFTADIWSFGVTLYYLIEGRFPYPVRYMNGVLNFFNTGIKNSQLEGKDEIIAYILQNTLVVNPQQRKSFKELKEAFIQSNEYKTFQLRTKTKIPKPTTLDFRKRNMTHIAFMRCKHSNSALIIRPNIKVL